LTGGRATRGEPYAGSVVSVTLAFVLTTGLAGTIPRAEAAQPIRFGILVLQASTPERPGSTSQPPVPRQAPRTPPSEAAPGRTEAEEQLQRILPRLRPLFRYTVYRPLAYLRGEGLVGTEQWFSVPGNCRLEVIPEKRRKSWVQMRVRLFDGNHEALQVGILAEPDTPVIFGGPPHGDGVLIVILWADPSDSRAGTSRDSRAESP
jgi:hypothetical protein